MTNAESQRRYRMRGTKKQRELEERVARLELKVLGAVYFGEARDTPIEPLGDGATQDITLP